MVKLVYTQVLGTCGLIAVEVRVLSSPLMPFVLNTFSYLRSFLATGNIYSTDILDIIIVTFFIYVGLLLLKQTKSYLLLVGVLILVGLYILSRLLNLYLTTLALQSVFSVLFIILIVVFQREIRRFLEVVAQISTRQIKVRHQTPATAYAADLVQCIAQFSHEKIGALIVLTGRDNIDRHLAGGVLSDSLISEELLSSIFDPHSEGHDGAAIITKSRLASFGVHLPLSNNFKEVGKHGTRHGAALGISEISDALAIVVSEEKGTISVAREGKLKLLNSVEELTVILNRFVKDNFGTEKPNMIRDFIKKDTRLKLLSLACALLLWATFAFRAETIRRVYTLPITFKSLPENTLIEDYSPKDIKITLESRGEVNFQNLGPDSFSLNLESSQLQNGLNQISITENNIRHPLNLNLVNIDPPRVYLSVKKYRPENVPVKITLVGQLAKGYSASADSDPQEVNLWVLEGTSTPKEISTPPIDISGATADIIRELELVLPPGVKSPSGEQVRVTVAITIAKQ